jgi:hypothetical protein
MGNSPHICPLHRAKKFFTAFINLEVPLGADIQNLLELTGIQQDLLIRFSDSSDRATECSPAEPIRPIGRGGIMAAL